MACNTERTVFPLITISFGKLIENIVSGIAAHARFNRLGRFRLYLPLVTFLEKTLQLTPLLLR